MDGIDSHKLVNPLRDLLEENGVHLSDAQLIDVARRTAAFVLAYVQRGTSSPERGPRCLSEMSLIERVFFDGEVFETLQNSEFYGKQRGDAYYLFSRKLVKNINERRPPPEIRPGGKTFRFLSRLCVERPDPTYDWETIRRMIPRRAAEVHNHPVFGISIEAKTARVNCMAMPEPDDTYACYLPTKEMAILRSIFDREVYIRGGRQGAIFYTRWLAAYIRVVNSA